MPDRFVQIDADVMHFRAYELTILKSSGDVTLGFVVVIGGNCTHTGSCGTGNKPRNQPSSMQNAPAGLKTQREYWYLDTTRYGDLKTSGAHIKVSVLGDGCRHWPADYSTLEDGIKKALGGNTGQRFNLPRQLEWKPTCDLTESTPNLKLFRFADSSGEFLEKNDLLYLIFGGPGGNISRLEWWRRLSTNSDLWAGESPFYLKECSTGDLKSGDHPDLFGNFARHNIT